MWKLILPLMIFIVLNNAEPLGYRNQAGTRIVRCKGPNEIYRICGSCDPTCDELNPKCPAMCRNDCFCISGFARLAGVCVKKSKCPKKYFG